MSGSVSYNCVRICHRTFPIPQNLCTLGTADAEAAFWYEEGISKLVSRYDKCLNVQGTMWRSRWRCVIKPAYSVSFLLSKNIFYGKTFFTFRTTFVQSLHSQICVYINIFFNIEMLFGQKKLKKWDNSKSRVPKKSSCVPLFRHPWTILSRSHCTKQYQTKNVHEYEEPSLVWRCNSGFKSLWMWRSIRAQKNRILLVRPISFLVFKVLTSITTSDMCFTLRPLQYGEKDQVPFKQEAGCSSELVWTL